MRARALGLFLIAPCVLLHTFLLPLNFQPLGWTNLLHHQPIVRLCPFQISLCLCFIRAAVMSSRYLPVFSDSSVSAESLANTTATNISSVWSPRECQNGMTSQQLDDTGSNHGNRMVKCRISTFISLFFKQQQISRQKTPKRQNQQQTDAKWCLIVRHRLGTLEKLLFWCIFILIPRINYLR